MKIIFCTFLLCITAVSVFGQSVELKGTLGKSIEFPAAVKKGGSLMYGTLTIGEVASSSFRTPRSERFNGRVQWDSSTGFFSLSGLKMEDIGEYEVQNTDQNINTVFQLNMHAVSVFGQSVELNGILGQSVKFPAAVEKGGSLMYGTLPIGDSSLETPGKGKYKGRVQWDSSTGLFSLSGLKMEDIGEYNVQNKDQIIAVFQLIMHVPVSKPNVTFISKEYPCILRCTVESGTQGTMFWYRDSEKNPQSRSNFLITPYWKEIQAMLGSRTYTCEVNNSVSNDKTSVNLEDHCRGGAAGIWQTEGSKMWSLSLVLIVMLCSRLV